MTDDERAKMEPEFNRALDLRETNPHESIRILKKLDNQFPDQATIAGMLGGIYHAMEDWTNALPYYERAVNLSPRSELASVGLFHSLWHHERFDDAMSEARRFIRRNGLSKRYELLMNELDDGAIFD